MPAVGQGESFRGKAPVQLRIVRLHPVGDFPHHLPAVRHIVRSGVPQDVASEVANFQDVAFGKDSHADGMKVILIPAAGAFQILLTQIGDYSLRLLRLLPFDIRLEVFFDQQVG